MRISDWSSDVCSSDLDIETLLAEAPSFGAQVEDLLVATYADLSCTFADVGATFAEIGTDEQIAALVHVLRSSAGARDALDAAIVPPGDGGADGYYLGGSFGVDAEQSPPTYSPTPELPRSEERRVGKAVERTCSYRCSRCH